MQQPDAWPAVVPPDVSQDLSTEAQRATILSVVTAFAQRAAATIVNDQRSFEGASETLREVATLAKALDERRQTEGKPLFDAKAIIDGDYKPALDALKNARATLETARNTYQREQDRIAREAQEKANRAAQLERERALRDAQKAEERGDFTRAAQLEQKADSVVAPVIATQAPKAAGVSGRTVWKWQLEDAKKLPPEYLCPDEAAISAYVKSLGERAVGRIPGVRVYSDQQTVVRSK